MDTVGYYSAVSQIIPVLTLALIFQARVFRIIVDDGNSVARSMIVLVATCGILVLGEVAALKGIYSGKSDVRTITTVAAMVIGSVWLFTSIAYELSIGNIAPGDRRYKGRRTLLTAVVLVGVIAVTLIGDQL
jgi:hypothetical protein